MLDKAMERCYTLTAGPMSSAKKGCGMTTARRSFSALRPLGVLALLAALLAVLAPGPSPAESAFPGANGKICFTSNRDGNDEIYVMNADGTNQTRLTNNL